MTAVRLIAPAKINWTLEVLRVRPDGYHDVSSLLSTIDLHDALTLTEDDGISIELGGEPGLLAAEDPEMNLAYRAAVAFRDRTGIRRGAHITIEKHVPMAAGLGGGSSDAAAVLRGLNAMWNAGQPELNLIEIAGEIGSDPPFFIAGGTAEVGGRGEQVTALPDAIAPAVLLALPRADAHGAKTASMYAALTPDHYSEGDATIGAREAVAAARPISDAMLTNVFERVIGRTQPHTANAMNALRAQGHSPHLCGSGPAFFLLAPPDEDVDAVAERIADLGFDPKIAQTMKRADATRIEFV